MRVKVRHLSLSLLGLAAFFAGVVAAGSFFAPAHSEELRAVVASATSVSGGTRIVPGKFAPSVFSPPASGKMIGLDLDRETVHLFENGAIDASFPLSAIAPEGSLWETLPGSYMVNEKRLRHISPIARLQVPWVVQFSGNSFFHGAPEPPLGKESASALTRIASYASLRLSDEGAERLYNFAEVGTPVTVLGAGTMGERLRLAAANSLDPALTFVAKEKAKPKLTAYAYVLKDLETGTVLLSERTDDVVPIASVSKLVTALVVDKMLTRERMATVSARAAATEGAAGNLAAGERVAVEDLMYALLLPSSNKAAEVLAETASRERFLTAMNETVHALGMNATSFRDPSGLNPRNVSTASDLAALAEYLAEERQDILGITTTLDRESASSGHRWSNPNRLIVNRNPHYIGGKTGYIPEAGQTSIAIFSFPVSEFVEKRFVLVLLRSYNRDADTRAVLRYLENGLVYDTGIPPTDDDLFSRFATSVSTMPLVASLVAVGNIVPTDSFEAELFRQGSSYGKVFSANTFLSGASVAIGNLVGPVTTAGTLTADRSPLRTPRRALTALSANGLSVLHVANDHLGDWGRSGVSQTLDELVSAGVDALGAGDDGRVARSVQVREANGVRFGLLGVSTVGPAWLFEDDHLPVALRADDSNLMDLVRDSSNKVDHLIVTLGLDPSLSPERSEVRRLAESLIDAGASAVIGMGPHSLGSFERYREGVIAYSLGDFFREPNEQEKVSEGLALELIFDRERILAVNAEQVTMNAAHEPVLISTEN